ncbi:MAG: beta-lactamase family protein [Proteobacteria bacterium]|nr:beta-lactamase family protein [Pseudomonadota bacterium]
MKRILLGLIFAPLILLALNEPQVYKTAMGSLVKHYNDKQFEAVFDMYSLEMKSALSLDETLSFFNGLDNQLGLIKETKFVKLQSKQTAIYKTTFQQGTMSVNLTLNNSNEISGMYFIPFVEERKIVKAQSKLDFANISTKQQQKIISHSKKFPNGSQLSIAIINNGSTQYLGLKRDNNNLIEVDNHNKVFEIGSITKVFTSTLLAHFVNDKQIKLDDAIAQFLGFSFSNNEKITFKELASHHSGLPRLPTNFKRSKISMDNPYKNYGAKKLEVYLKNDLELSKKNYNYSNLGTGLLAHTLSKISHKSYEELLKQYIFKPLKMKNSTTNRMLVNSQLIKGLNAQGEITSNWDLNALAGAGAILSTVEDLAKFAIAQFDTNNKVYAMTRAKTFAANSGMDVGLGWHLIKQGSGKYLYWHTGGTGGYSSSMIVDTENKKSVIILSNVSAFNPDMQHIDGLAFDLMLTL